MKSKLQFILLKLEHPEFFEDEIFPDEDLLSAINGRYAKKQEQKSFRIWKILGENLDAYIFDAGNGWSYLLEITDKKGKVLWKRKN